MSKILELNKLRPDTALENLNRLTGLDFQEWPTSLLEEPVSSSPDTDTRASNDTDTTPVRQYGQQG